MLRYPEVLRRHRVYARLPTGTLLENHLGLRQPHLYSGRLLLNPSNEISQILINSHWFLANFHMHFDRSGPAGHTRLHVPGLVHQSRLGTHSHPAVLHPHLHDLQIYHHQRDFRAG